MDKVLFIIRGASGSGKTTLAEYLAKQHGVIASADDFLINEKGEYDWHWSKLSKAHADCEAKVKSAMEYGIGRIIVANTFVSNKDIQPYIDMAKAHNYKYFSIVVENRHGGINSHDVPEERVEQQKKKLLNNIIL